MKMNLTKMVAILFTLFAMYYIYDVNEEKKKSKIQNARKIVI